MQNLKEATASKTQTVLEQLCKKLHCSQIADDLERVRLAREMLAKLQEEEIFNFVYSKEDDIRKSVNHQIRHSIKNLANLLQQTKARLSFSAPQKYANISETSRSSAQHTDDMEEVTEEEECEYEWERSVKCEDLSEDAWLGYFRGYDILDEQQEYVLGENKQCVLLSLNDASSKLENYLRCGIRCFMIDLFTGTELENQEIIYNLRESELKISKEYGFPITTTLFAMLSPRLQYTGLMNEESFLNVSDELILTTNRKYSNCGTRVRVYVNASFLIEDCREGDFILIGPDIQVTITQVLDFDLKCKVMAPGVLKSRLPVRFPGRCKRSNLSIEELENITFAREVGIKILVSYIPGTQKYVEELNEALSLLHCKNLRLFTRIVLNDFKGDIKDFEWIAEKYDGFFLDLKVLQQTTVCSEPEAILPDLLRFSEGADGFITKVYNMMKPIILNPLLIAERQLHVQPYNDRHIFYYPDRYIFSTDNFGKSFFFHLLQNAMISLNQMPEADVSQPLYCDPSESVENSLARACVDASFKCQAKAIVVCSSMPDMTIKLSHFRPQVPIVLVSATKSIGDYISIYHNVYFLRFHTYEKYEYKEVVTKSFTFALIYLTLRWQLQDTENVLLVYSTERDATLCDKYLIFKFQEENFARHLEDVLFH